MASRKASRMVMVTISVPAGISGSAATLVSGACGAAFATGAAGALASALGATGGAGSAVFCAAAGIAALIADLSSPSPRMTPIGVLTATSAVPSGTRILPSVPSSTASTSMVALSVSISAMTSPALTLSPTCLCHFARLPSVMVGESAGIRISIGILCFPLVVRAGSAIGHGFGRRDHIRDLRQRQTLEIGGVGQRHVLAADPRHRRIEPIEGALHDLRRDLRADAREGPTLLDRDDAVGLLDGGEDGLDVERPDGAKVDHFRRDALARERLSSPERNLHHARMRHHRDRLAREQHARLADRH